MVQDDSKVIYSKGGGQGGAGPGRPIVLRGAWALWLKLAPEGDNGFATRPWGWHSSPSRVGGGVLIACAMRAPYRHVFDSVRYGVDGDVS